MNKNWKRLWNSSPIALLVIFTLIFFSEILFSGKSLYGSDFINYFYPVKRFIREYFLANGTLLFWNPYLLSGTPFITNIQASMFYPLGFIYYLVPPEIAYVYSTVFHCIMGILFMYLFMRTLSVTKWGAFLSAFIFIFNGYFMAHLYAGHLTFVQNYIWIPLVFYFLYRFIQKSNYSDAVLAGLILGIQILGGFPQITFYTIFASVLYLLYSICMKLYQQNCKKHFQIIGGLVIVLIVGFSLAAIQLLPTYEFVQLSTRAGSVDYEFATFDSLPPKHFLTFLIPHLFGSAVNNTFWVSHISWKFWEYCGYVGICALILIFSCIKRMIADRECRYFIVVIAISLFLSMGKYNPLYRFIYHLPGFHDFRIPAQILFLSTFSFAVLAGKGFDYLKNVKLSHNTYRIFVFITLSIFLTLTIWLYSPPDIFFHLLFKYLKPTGLTLDMSGKVHSIVESAVLRSYVIFLCIVIALYLYEKRRVSYNLVGVLLILISIADLWSFSSPMIQVKDLRPIQKNSQFLEYFRQDNDIYRAVIKNSYILNAGLWYRFQDIHGYDPLVLGRYVRYINRSQQIHLNTNVVNMHYIKDFDNNLIDMLNLKYIVDCKSETIIKRDSFVPRAYVVHKMIIKDKNEILDYMMGDNFDPIKTVVFENRPNYPVSLSEPIVSTHETCRIINYENEQIVVAVELKTPGFLVMSEINYPGWRAEVDGKRVPILSGNYIFRVIPLEKGEHEVRLYFISLPFYLGLFISLLTLFGSLWFLLSKRKKALKTIAKRFMIGIPSANDK